MTSNPGELDMAQARQILIADPDLEAVRLLSRALRERGHQVHYAPDGPRALEVAILRHPDLILFDEACPFLEAKTFVQIIRSNPRTADIPVVLTTSTLDTDRLRAFRDGVLKKPFNLDEVLARIDHIFRRSEAAKNLGSESEIEGSLSQLGIADLLQMLAMNKRSGRLSLASGGERGEIQVGEGRPMNARIGAIEGEKALFRLVSWMEGTFSFTPGPASSRPRIQRSMEDALLEGMHQSDELGRLLPSLPQRAARIQLAPEADLPKDQHPVTSEVVELLAQPRALSELMDLAQATDLEILTVVSTLIQKGAVRIVEGEPGDPKAPPLLGPAEVHALRTRVFRGRAPTRTAVAKVFVCGTAPGAGRRVLSGVAGLRRVAPEPPAVISGFGTLGRYEISEALHIDFFLLPPGEPARPLWRPFCAGAVGALVLDDSAQAAGVAHWLAMEARVPLVVVGGKVPPLLEKAPAGVMAAGTDLIEALRALLVQSLHPPQPATALPPEPGAGA
jgi:CheY-like chemotaxis protein